MAELKLWKNSVFSEFQALSGPTGLRFALSARYGLKGRYRSSIDGRRTDNCVRL